MVRRKELFIVTKLSVIPIVKLVKTHPANDHRSHTYIFNCNTPVLDTLSAIEAVPLQQCTLSKWIHNGEMREMIKLPHFNRRALTFIGVQ